MPSNPHSSHILIHIVTPLSTHNIPPKRTALSRELKFDTKTLAQLADGSATVKVNMSALGKVNRSHLDVTTSETIHYITFNSLVIHLYLPQL